MRLSLIPEAEVTPLQRPLYDALNKRLRASYTDFQTKRQDGALLGPWGVWLHSPSTGDAVRQFVDAVEAMPGLSRKAVQVAVLVTGAHFDAAYELYAHAIIAANAGLASVQVATLCAGEIPNDLDAECTLTARVVRKLLSGGVLPEPLYDAAVAGLGQDGLIHLSYVVGQYCMVSMTLNAFDVPARI